MKVLVVDDEPLARDRLRQLLENIENCAVCGEAGTGREALQQCNGLQPDVVLMDIRMPDMDGLEAARHLVNVDQPPAVIFTTAYSDHALEAFDAHALDYLLKPIRKQRLSEALERARRLTHVQVDALAGQADAGERRHICARVRGDLVLIPVADIRYFQADQKYVTVGYDDGKVLIEESLKSIEQEFSGRLVRIHRNALVAWDYLAGLERGADGQYRVRLKGIEETLEVSRRLAGELRQKLKKSKS